MPIQPYKYFISSILYYTNMILKHYCQVKNDIFFVLVFNKAVEGEGMRSDFTEGFGYIGKYQNCFVKS